CLLANCLGWTPAEARSPVTSLPKATQGLDCGPQTTLASSSSSRCAEDREEMLDSLSPQRRRVVLVTAALAGLLVVALIATSVVRGMARSVDPVPQDQPGPVPLVPGYGG